ncbi:unnamed protein product [Closterium sp. NIES-65]|nr:unnamed protein product [Closterium sp. NIES-65]
MPVRRMGLVESVLDKLFTDEGRTFASAVVGKAMRSLVVSLVDKLSSPPGSGSASGASSAAGSRQALTGWELILVELATNEKGKALLTDIVATFAVNAVGTFIEKTRNVNVYNDILAAVSRHQELVKDVGAHILTRTAETTVATAMAPIPPERAARQAGSASGGMGAGFEEVIQTEAVSVALSTSSDGSSSEAPSPSESLSPRSRSSLDGQLQDPMWQGVPDATVSVPQTAAAAAAAASSASLRGKLTTFFRRLPPPPPPALQTASTSAASSFPGSQALSTTWQRQLTGFLAEKEVRGLVVEVAGAVSARGMRAFLLVLFHNLLSSQPSRTARGKGEAGSSMFQHQGIRSRIQVVSGGDDGEQGDYDVTADDDLALEASELERVAEVSSAEADSDDATSDHLFTVPQLAPLSPSDEPFDTSKLLPPLRSVHFNRKTLVLDLDETLIHSVFTPIMNADFVISLDVDGRLTTIYVHKRPGVEEFLRAVAQVYEVVVFTASMAGYANALVDLLDPQRCLVHHRLFRDSCIWWRNSYVKDLTMLGRDLTKTMIVDNSPLSYAFQPENGIAIPSYYDEQGDRELAKLVPVLMKLAAVEDDVRLHLAGLGSVHVG